MFRFFPRHTAYQYKQAVCPKPYRRSKDKTPQCLVSITYNHYDNSLFCLPKDVGNSQEDFKRKFYDILGYKQTKRSDVDYTFKSKP